MNAPAGRAGTDPRHAGSPPQEKINFLLLLSRAGSAMTLPLLHISISNPQLPDHLAIKE